MSTRAVAARLPKRLSVSHTTIAGYENGTSMPPVDVLGALATLYQRTINWFLEDRTGLSEFRYQNLKSGARLTEKRHFEAVAGRWVDAYVSLESHLKADLHQTAADVPEEWEAGPRHLAGLVRQSLGIGETQPIQSTMSLLEAFAVRVIELRTELPTDGVAAQHDGSIVLIVNPNTSNERLRMNAVQELARVLYSNCGKQFGWTESVVERQAYDFASSLLLPDSQLEAAFRGQSFLRLIEFKERFGISLAAMIHRAETSRIIRSTTARWLWSEMSHRGWRKEEPGYVWRDRALRFETLMESAIQSKTLTWGAAENVTGIREDELKSRLASATEYGNAQQREKDGDEDDVRILKLAFGNGKPSLMAE